MSLDPESKSELREAVKEVLLELLPQLMAVVNRPSVTSADSGVSSSSREYMPSEKLPKVTVRVYHENPFLADLVCSSIYDTAMAFRQDHRSGALPAHAPEVMELWLGDSK